jgi:hypothetical protein
LGSLQACGSFDKLSYELPALIRESEYALSWCLSYYWQWLYLYTSSA